MLGVSLLAASLFSPYIFGLTTSGLSSQVPVAYAVISAVMLIVVGRVLVPRYLEMKINTVPEFFEKRFDKNCRRFLSVIYILSNVGIRLVVILAMGKILLDSIAGIDSFSSLLFFLVVTGLYVIIGGLQAEIHANLVQVAFIVLAVVGFMSWLLSQENGFNMMAHKIASSAHLDSGSASEYSRTGLFIGLPIIGFWFWCADQLMVQKMLSVREVQSARRGSLAGAVLQVVPLLIFLLAGIVAPTAWRTDPEGPLHWFFSNGSMPDSLRAGLIIGAVAAFMIPVANVFNSTSALITFDFFYSGKPEASDRQVVLVGRITAMILVLISILLIPISQTMDMNSCIQLFKIFLYFSAMIAGVFIVGLFNRKVTGASVLFSLSSGTFVILLRVVLQMIVNNHQLESGLLSWFVQSTFLEFSVFIFLVSLILLVIFNFLKLKYESSIHRNLIEEKFNVVS